MSKNTDAAKPAANQMPSWAKLIALSAHFLEAHRLLSDLLKNSPELLERATLSTTMDLRDWDYLNDKLVFDYNPAFYLIHGGCPNGKNCFVEFITENIDMFPEGSKQRKEFVESNLDMFRRHGIDTADIEELCK